MTTSGEQKPVAPPSRTQVAVVLLIVLVGFMVTTWKWGWPPSQLVVISASIGLVTATWMIVVEHLRRRKIIQGSIIFFLLPQFVAYDQLAVHWGRHGCLPCPMQFQGGCLAAIFLGLPVWIYRRRRTVRVSEKPAGSATELPGC